MVNSAHFVKSTSLRVLSLSFQYFVSMLQTYWDVHEVVWWWFLLLHLWQIYSILNFLDHCNAYLVTIVFHFKLEDRTMVLVVTVPYYCLSLTLHNFIFVLFHFGQLRLWANLRRIIMMLGYTESKKNGRNMESIQLSTTPDPGHQWESDNFTIRQQKWEPRGHPFPSRWPQGINKQTLTKA